MQIFQAKIADLESSAELFNEYRQFYGKQDDLTAARKFIAERLQKNDSIILIARTNNCLAGFLQIYPSFSSLSLSSIWILNDLLVRPEFRQQGIARALINRAISLAKDNKISSILLETAPDNCIAQKLYGSLNFKLDETYHHYQLSL